MKSLEITIELTKLLNDYLADIELAEDMAEDIIILLQQKIIS
jgi:hypothetical protein